MSNKGSNHPIELTLEQQFALRSFATQVQAMSSEQAKEFLVDLYEHMLVRETLYKEMLKQEWKLGDPPQ